MKRYLITALSIMILSSLPLLRTNAGGEQNSVSNQEQKLPPHKLSQEQEEALGRLSKNLTEVQLSNRAVPSWLMGELGPAGVEPKSAAVQTMRSLAPVFRIRAEDDFEPKSMLEDGLGQVHVRLQQRYRGLPVVGGELIVHIQGNRTIGVNGNYIPDLSIEVTPALSADAAIGLALSSISASNVRELSSPEPVVFATKQIIAHLAWSQLLSYVGAEGEFRIDRIFADARTGEVLDRHPQIMTLLDRRIYDGGKQCLTGFNSYILPGTFLFGEGGESTSTNTIAKSAYKWSGASYSFYKNSFNRDSYDNLGSPLISTVHIKFGQISTGSCTPNNAAWFPSLGQIAYGDGDGNLFGPLSESLDITAHEFTHGVTSSTANLVYSGESGALNEATSDIMGECAEAYIKGTTDWKIGEDVYTPDFQGDALRYMYDPAKDGISADFYGDTFPSNCAAYDGCEVHRTSGIANLAFYLLVNGGTHPRNKSRVVVPAIGIAKAQQIWYRALTVYMTSSTNFADARDTTMHAASDLHGGLCSSATIAVDKAWDAVGVFGLPNFRPSCGSINILRNPGFESTNGQGWTFTGNINFIPVWISHTQTWATPHSGNAMATIGASCPSNSTLYQQVTIPSSADRATFSFWLHVNTQEPQNSLKDDILRVQIRDTSNNLLTTLAKYSNFDANTDYVRKSFDVSAYRGQTVRVYFEGEDSIFYDCSHLTYFFIDDTALIVE